MLDGLSRYDRQTRFAPIGRQGQLCLSEAAVLVAGTGALGAALAEHMVRAGIGTVRLVDRDYVELSNLQRQRLFDEQDAEQGLPKAVAAANKLRRINSDVCIEPHVLDLTRQSAYELAEGTALVLDGTDNAAARLALSDACYRLGIPYVFGGITAASGMSATFVPGETACLRCAIGGEEALDEGASCETAGIIAPIVEMIAAVQAAETLKWLSGARDALRRTWLTAELWPFAVRETRMPQPVRDCPVCGDAHLGLVARHAPFDAEVYQVPAEPGRRVEEWGTAVLCGRDSVQVTLGRALPAAGELERHLRSQGCRTERNPYLVRAWTMEGLRLVLFPEGRILVQGTGEPSAAKEACRLYLTMEAGAIPAREEMKADA
jgi:molybdopterin-synthase adenylyltransferase